MSGFGFRVSGEGFLKKKKQRERNEREREMEKEEKIEQKKRS